MLPVPAHPLRARIGTVSVTPAGRSTEHRSKIKPITEDEIEAVSRGRLSEKVLLPQMPGVTRNLSQ